METGLEAFVALCRKSEIKVTPQRLEIYKEIISADNHPSAEYIYQNIRSRLPGISRDTVYRTLSSFQEWGLISQVPNLDEMIRFDPNTQPHHHFVCEKCRKLIDFSWSEFDSMAIPAKLNGIGTIHNRHVEIYGLCQECASKEQQ